MDSPSSSQDETVNEPAAARLLRNPWLWVGVFAAGVALVGAFAFLAQRDKRLAREEYDKALRDYLAAGLPDPFATPAPRGPVPTAAQGNLLFAPVFDGLMVIRPGSGAYAKFSMNESAAIRAKVDDVGQFTFCASGAPFWAFDPAAHFADKAKRSRLVAALPPGATPANAFTSILEREFPELKSLAQIEASHPQAVYPDPERPVLFSNDFLIPEFKCARATAHVLTAYAGCKALEGDGGPAAAAVCGLARHFGAEGANDTRSLVGAMINVVVAKNSIPRLTHLAIREGLWTNDQLRRVGEILGRVRLLEGAHEAVFVEQHSSLPTLRGLAVKDPRYAGFLKDISGDWWAVFEHHGMSAAFREPGVWRNLSAFLRDGVAFTRTRNEDGQYDVVKLVALSDSFALNPHPEATALFYLAVPARNKVLANAATVEAQVKSARLACALELYRRAHGAYPEKLDALVPQYLPALPVSSWVGGNLEYAVTPAGYTLTWPKADYYNGGSGNMGGVRVDVQRPGPWEILGEKIELPEFIRSFDKRSVVSTPVSSADIVWMMPAPKNAKGFATPTAN